MKDITIRNVRAICTAPAGNNLIVVKVETSEPELYGLGCATFAYRHKAVKLMVEEYLDPLLKGRNVDDIDELWQLMNNNSYWRNGPVENDAVSGVDMALWDIKGKLANMPLYSLLGGKTRKAVAVYRHAGGGTLEEIAESVEKFRAEGIQYIRIQWGGYGGKASPPSRPEGAYGGSYYDQAAYVRDTITMFGYVRKKVGYEAELLHDSHERITPPQALLLAKELEPYRLFFLEDLLSPEQSDYFRLIRSQVSTPLAMGELFNNPKEWDYLIRERLIDYIRVHISEIGGITPARKLAVFCEAFGVRTAWHGPGDVSPVGHAANIHLDLNAVNFGIQEWAGINDTLAEVFPGSPVLKNGYVYANDKPGLGIDIDEKLANKYPCSENVTTWTQTRVSDGALFTP